MIRRLLVIGYLTGIQVWDCSDLTLVKEILNLKLVSPLESNTNSSPSIGVPDDKEHPSFYGRYPVYAGILPKSLERHVVAADGKTRNSEGNKDKKGATLNRKDAGEERGGACLGMLL